MLRIGVRAASKAAAASLLVSTALAGCASTVSQMNASQAQTSSYVADHVPVWADGEPASLPTRPTTPPAYPNVFATQPPHPQKLMTDEEEKRDEAALATARAGAAARIKAVAAAEQQRAAQTNALAADVRARAAARDRLAEQQAGVASPN